LTFVPAPVVPLRPVMPVAPVWVPIAAPVALAVPGIPVRIVVAIFESM
jgi:hypothetical protein